MFSYGRIYNRLSAQALSLILERRLGGFSSALARLYLSLFGYPDIAGQLRYPLALRLLNPKEDESILDAGCGNGIYANSLVHLFKVKVVGVDLNKEHLKRASAAQKSLGLATKFEKMSLSDLNFDSSSFDKIICLEVLEHIKDDKKTLSELARVLKNGGLLVLSVPKKKENLSPKEEEEYEHPKPFGHVRSGYTEAEIKRMAKTKDLNLEEKIEYYRLFSDLAIRIQQFFDLRGIVFLNIITYPALNLIAHLDVLLGDRGYFKGYIFLFKKQ